MTLELGDLQNHSNEEKGTEEKREKAMVALLVFIMATLVYFVAEKKKGRKIETLEAKGPFGGNVFKNPARYTFLYINILSLFRNFFLIQPPESGPPQQITLTFHATFTSVNSNPSRISTMRTP